MKYFLYSLLLSFVLAPSLTSCDDDADESDVIDEVLTADVVGFYKGIVYLPTVGYEIGLLNKPNHQAVYYRNPGDMLSDTTSGQRWVGTWRLEADGSYHATIYDDRGDAMYFEDEDVRLPGQNIDGYLTFENDDDLYGQFNLGRQQPQ